ncbi:MAG: hypothetical protein RLZZ175_471 [Bacteroidota bacterium]|jgi:hypothetical protein
MSSFLKIVTNSFKLNLYFFKNLPLALIAGLKVLEANDLKVVVAVRYSFLTKNPFKSMYFACMAMAAELSTGVLVLNAVQESGKNISTLVSGLEAEFVKKGLGLLKFECINGKEIKEAIEKSIITKESQVIKTESIGYNQNGEIVSKFTIYWSVKYKF